MHCKTFLPLLKAINPSAGVGDLFGQGSHETYNFLVIFP